jgi:hypothetical protein
MSSAVDVINRPLRVLSLGMFVVSLQLLVEDFVAQPTESVADGGGIRGLSTLIILKRLMHTIRRENDLHKLPKPCQYFDLIGGTSTGGSVETKPLPIVSKRVASNSFP